MALGPWLAKTTLYTRFALGTCNICGSIVFSPDHHVLFSPTHLQWSFCLSPDMQGALSADQWEYHGGANSWLWQFIPGHEWHHSQLLSQQHRRHGRQGSTGQPTSSWTSEYGVTEKQCFCWFETDSKAWCRPFLVRPPFCVTYIITTTSTSATTPSKASKAFVWRRRVMFLWKPLATYVA